MKNIIIIINGCPAHMGDDQLLVSTVRKFTARDNRATLFTREDAEKAINKTIDWRLKNGFNVSTEDYTMFEIKL